MVTIHRNIWAFMEGYVVTLQGILCGYLTRILSSYHTAIVSGYHTRNMVVIIKGIYVLSYEEYGVYYTENILFIVHRNIFVIMRGIQYVVII